MTTRWRSLIGTRRRRCGARLELRAHLVHEVSSALSWAAHPAPHCDGDHSVWTLHRAHAWALGLRATDHADSNLFPRGQRFVDDVMVHEMLHVWLVLTGQDSKHDSDDWYAAIRRLSPHVLGHTLDVTRGSGRRSVRVPNPRAGKRGEPKTFVRKVATELSGIHGDVARWPTPFRPSDYDWGPPIACPSY